MSGESGEVADQADVLLQWCVWAYDCPAARTTDVYNEC